LAPPEAGKPLPQVGGEGKGEGELPDVERKPVFVLVKPFALIA